VTPAGQWAGRRLSAIVIADGSEVQPDETIAALVENTPDSVETKVATLGEVNAAVGPADDAPLCLFDARVRAQPGWYAPLVAMLDPRGGRRDAVCATPRVVTEDGRLAEAGTMVACDGSWYAVGAGNAEDDPAARFPRPVDGSSRALLLAPDAFLRAGGLDERFTTFSAAAMDLCLRLAGQGGTVWYQPSSRVTWAARRRADDAQPRGTDRAVFGERHGAAFEHRPGVVQLDTFPHRAMAIRDALALDRVLLIDDRVPHHDRGAGDPRMRQIVEEMITLWPHARITLLAADPVNAGEYAPALLEQGIEVVWPSDVDTWLSSRLFHYSIVVVSRPDNFSRFDAALRRTQPQALRVYDVEALFFRRLDRMKPIVDSQRDREALRELLRRDRTAEVTAAAEADATWCVTAEEQAVLSAVAPSTPRFPLAYYTTTRSHPPGFATRTDVLFFGGFLAGAGSANEDALLYVVEEIMPRLWKQAPDLKLHVVGADATPAVLSLDSELVNVVGYVPDPLPWLDRTLVHVAPMRFGSGLKLRFVETLAAGQPLVTSSVGAEGLGLGELADALVADDADAQASLALELIGNRSRWEEAQRGVLTVAAERFSRERFRLDLVEAMSHLGVAPPDVSTPL
jgi:glycosyltransferase involved in cell wall biosynthesis